MLLYAHFCFLVRSPIRSVVHRQKNNGICFEYIIYPGSHSGETPLTTMNLLRQSHRCTTEIIFSRMRIGVFWCFIETGVSQVYHYHDNYVTLEHPGFQYVFNLLVWVFISNVIHIKLWNQQIIFKKEGQWLTSKIIFKYFYYFPIFHLFHIWKENHAFNLKVFCINFANCTMKSTRKKNVSLIFSKFPVESVKHSGLSQK